jgi:hypothetical protein
VVEVVDVVEGEDVDAAGAVSRSLPQPQPLSSATIDSIAANCRRARRVFATLQAATADCGASRLYCIGPLPLFMPLALVIDNPEVSKYAWPRPGKVSVPPHVAVTRQIRHNPSCRTEDAPTTSKSAL